MPSAAEQRAKDDIQALRNAANDSDAQLAVARKLVAQSTHMEVIRAALKVIEQAHEDSDHDLIVAKYQWCAEQPTKRDGSGYIRAALIRTLQPVIQSDDRQMVLQALQSYQTIGLYEVCAELRAVALLAMNDIDPDTAELFACRFLNEHSPANFSGEPARTSAKLLAAHQHIAPLFGAVSTGNVSDELAADMLRSLIDIPNDLLPLVVEQYKDRDNEQEILGLADLLLGHRTREDWAELFARWLTDPSLDVLSGVIAMQIVASRSPTLIALLRQLAADEPNPTRRSQFNQALELA